jgi:aminomethyltransferase
MIINDPEMRLQHEAVRNTVGWYCWTHFLLEVTGEDATALLDKIYVSSIAKLKVGRAKYTTMVNDDGIIIDDVIVFRIEDEKYWISTLHLNNVLIPWLDEHKGDSKVEYIDITDITEMYAVQGPKSRDLLNSFLAENIDDQKFFSIRNNKIDGIPVKVGRSGYTGELGYEVYTAPENVDLLKEKLSKHGKSFGAVEVTEFQVKVWSLASEKGYNLMSDLRKTNPFEVGFENAIDWSKDFIGKQALEKVKLEGPRRQLLGFVVDDESVQIEGMNRGCFGAIVKVNSEAVGRVTKYVYSYSLNKSIGFALVDIEKAKIGDRATISGHEATLTNKIWYDPENNKPLGK